MTDLEYLENLRKKMSLNHNNKFTNKETAKEDMFYMLDEFYQTVQECIGLINYTKILYITCGNIDWYLNEDGVEAQMFYYDWLDICEMAEKAHAVIDKEIEKIKKRNSNGMYYSNDVKNKNTDISIDDLPF